MFLALSKIGSSYIINSYKKMGTTFLTSVPTRPIFLTLSPSVYRMLNDNTSSPG
jgi:hypothetical protein